MRLPLDDEPAQAARIETWLAGMPRTASQVHIADVVLAEATWTLASVSLPDRGQEPGHGLRLDGHV